MPKARARVARERLTIPLAVAHRAIGGRDAPRECQEQRHRQLRRRDRVAGGSGEHRDTALGGGVDVNRVHADAGAADHLQAIRATERVARDLGGRAHEHRIAGGNGVAQFVAFESRFHGQLETRVGRQGLQRIECDGIGHQDLERLGHVDLRVRL
jgi:hypothetical protein